MIAALIVNALYIFGLKAAMGDGMILGFVPTKLQSLPEWLKMPLFSCPICMASIHSYVGFAYIGASIETLLIMPFYIVMLAGLNFIVINLLD
jgi:hypothetical protein